MGIEENIELVMRYITDFNNINILSDVDAIRDLAQKYMHPDYIVHHSVGDLTFEQNIQMHNRIFRAFPDVHMEVEDVFAANDKVFARIRTTGTHKDEFKGYAATGKAINLLAALVFQVLNGKFFEAWDFVDVLTMYNQLGINLSSQ